jgi:hypothetical protein
MENEQLENKVEEQKDQLTGRELTVKLTTKQLEAYNILTDHESAVRQMLFGGSLGGGKSFLGTTWLCIQCVNYPKTRYFIARNELTEIRKSTLLTFYDAATKMGLKQDTDYKYNGQSNIIYFSNGSEIHLLAVAFQQSDPQFQFLGSTEYTAGFIEEAATVHPDAHRILFTRIRYKLQELGMVPKMLITANPNKGYTYRQFYMPWRDGDLPESKMYLPSTVFDNPFLSEEYKKSLMEMPKEEVQRLVYGSWETEVREDTLFQEHDKIVSMFDKEITDEDDHRYYIIVDVAHEGADKTVATVWRGFTCIEYRSFAKTKTTEVATIIKNRMESYNVPAGRVWVDATGIGAAIPDLVPGIKKFFTNSAPKPDGKNRLDHRRFDNIKTQCAYKLAKYISDGKISVCNISEDDKKCLIEDLEVIRKKDIDTEGKIGLVSKKELRKTLKRSPDGADTLIIRMAATLNPAINVMWI